MRKIILSFGLFLAVVASATTAAFAADDNQGSFEKKGLYLGLRLGAPVGFSAFSSFGEDKTSIGIGGGLFAGYHLSNIFSLEASASYSKARMNYFDCPYWLGVNGKQYYIQPDASLDGRYYNELYSQTNFLNLGLHANINVLGFFTDAETCRWSASLSPAVFYSSVDANVKTIDADYEIYNPSAEWQFGYGGGARVEYAINPNLSAGLYGEFIRFTGSPIDGLPETDHYSNHTFEYGVRLAWNFGKKKSTSNTIAPMPIMPAKQTSNQSATSGAGAAATTASGASAAATTASAANAAATTASAANAAATTASATSGASGASAAATTASATSGASAAATTASATSGADATATTASAADANLVYIDLEALKNMPRVKFEFNKADINEGNKESLDKIIETLKNNPAKTVLITGYGCKIGSEQANIVLSRRRAENVKSYLTDNGIESDRIETLAGGIKTDVENLEDARVVITVVKE